MIPEEIYIEDEAVDDRLQPFGFTREELVNVARKVLAVRSDTTSADVSSAPGLLSYIHGSRDLRLLALSKGYETDRQKNIESSRNPKTGTMIAYQNVNLACSKFYSPKAISGKGSGTADILDQAQGQLFTSDEAPLTVDLRSICGLNSTLWYFCVSFEENAFRAELSLPASIKDGNFSGFLERIFIANGQGQVGKPAETMDSDYAEFEPKITRK